MQTLWQDLRYGARMLVKQPSFTLMAVITLALGIGANTAIFSVVNTVLLKPAPYRDPQRLIQLVRTQQGRRREQVPPADFVDWREQSQAFEKLGAAQLFDANLSGGDAPERARGVRVTASIFPLLGVQPLVGRWPQESEDRAGGEPVAVISYSLWQQRYGADPAIIGRSLSINSRSHSVIGVMPDGFNFPAPYFSPGALWVLSGQQGTKWSDRTAGSLLVFARLKEGVSVDQAQAEMETIAARLARQYPETNNGTGVMLTIYGGTSIAASRPRLLLLFAAAGLVLLIACVNVVNLLLSRGMDRRREIAIRAALGAGRRRLVRQMLTESLLLFVIGGGLGLLAAMWGVELIVAHLRSFYLPRMEEATVDGTVAGFSFLLSLLAGAVAGLFPALQYSEVKLAASLNESGRSGGASGGWRRFQKVLIVSEVALSLVLLAGAGLLLRSFRQISRVDPGFKLENLRHLRMTLPAEKYPTGREQAAFYLQAVEQISTLPGVVAACAVDVPPGVGEGARHSFVVAGEPTSPSANEKRKAALRAITPDYFRTLEVSLKQGRAFTPADTADRPRIAIINETLQRQAFPNQAAIGGRLRVSTSESSGKEADSWEIVGIVADLKEEYLYRPVPPTIYLPLAQSQKNSVALLVRTASQAQDVVPDIRRRMRALDREQPLYGIRWLDRMLASEIDLHRLSLVLLSIFAILSLVLAMVGIYGVITHAVRQRTQEIGIRLALGAEPSQILRLVLGEGLQMIALGVGIGLLATWWLTRFLQTLLYGVSGTDLLTLAVVSLILAAVALLACYFPARRATKVDPMVALRYE